MRQNRARTAASRTSKLMRTGSVRYLPNGRIKYPSRLRATTESPYGRSRPADPRFGPVPTFWAATKEKND